MPNWFRWAWIGLGALAAFWLAQRAASFLVMTAFALLLSTALRPVVDWLDAHRLPHWLSVMTCFVMLLGLLSAVITYFVPVVVVQFQQFFAGLPSTFDRIDLFREAWADWRRQLPFLVPRWAEVGSWIQQRAGGWLQRTIGFAGTVGVLVAQGLTSLLLTFFFLKDGRALLDQVLRLIPPDRRPSATAVLARIGERLGGWVLGQLSIMAIVGIVAGLGLALLGVPYAALLGVATGLLEIVPYLGPVLAGFLAVAVSLTKSWTLGLWTAAFFVILQQVENHLLEPIVFSRAVGMHPVWIIAALFLGGVLGGVVGMILAVPIAIAAQVVIDDVYLAHMAPQHPTESTDLDQAA